MCVINITTITVTNGVAINTATNGVEYQYKLQSSGTWSATKYTTYGSAAVEDITVVGDYDLRVRVQGTGTGLPWSDWSNSTFSISYACAGDKEWTVDWDPTEVWDGQVLGLWYITYHTATELFVEAQMDTLPTVPNGGGAGINRTTICMADYFDLWKKNPAGDPTTPEVDSSISVTETATSC